MRRIVSGVVLLLAWPAVAEAPPSAEEVVDELLRPGCPALFDRLTPSFQQAVPRSQWPPFCASVAKGGERRALEPVGTDRGMTVYHLVQARGERKVGIAFDEKRRISGLFVEPWTPPVQDSRVRYRWPLTRTALVGWGGADEKLNQHVTVPRQRRATDLLFVDAQGRTHTGGGLANSDYFIESAEVVAAADGVVLVVVDGVPENEPGAMDNTLVPGNVIAIEHGPGEVAHYCHLKPGSAKVKPGNRVKAGQVIGLVGNSGHSSEPHLHFHVQTSPRMAEGVGVEPIFVGVCLTDGKTERPVPTYRLHKDDKVGPCTSR